MIMFNKNKIKRLHIVQGQISNFIQIKYLISYQIIYK